MMEKKRLFYFLSVFLIIFAINNCYADEVAERDIFAMKLTNMLTQPSDKSLNDFLQFAEEYPDSKFADDALYIVNLTIFTGAITKGDKNSASPYLKGMEDTLKRYQHGQIEEVTFQKWSEVKGQGTEWVLYIPYQNILLYMKGLLGFYTGDYELAIDNLLALKDKIDYDRANSETLEAEIYLTLVSSYAFLNRLEEGRNIAEEASNKFPYNKTLNQKLNKVISDKQYRDSMKKAFEE